MTPTPDSEYAAARDGAALVALGERGVLAVLGPLRQKFLHNMLSGAIQGLAPGSGCAAALLDVKGHLIALMRALVTDDAVLLEMAADRIAKVKETLLFYKVGAPVRFEERATGVLAVLGPRASESIARAGATFPVLAPAAHAAASIAGQPVRIARGADLPAGGYVVHAARDGAKPVEAALAAAGATPIGRDTLDVLRVEDGRPWDGPDLDQENLLHETGLLREYHSPDKGCYLGQEVVARLEGRGGHVNKQIRGLRLAAPAAAGAGVSRDGKAVGRVTTAGVSPRLGPVALALLHRSALEPGTLVEVDGREATVAALPLAAGPGLVTTSAPL